MKTDGYQNVLTGLVELKQAKFKEKKKKKRKKLKLKKLAVNKKLVKVKEETGFFKV